jgi:O-antigen/teichoic acid export membrane protein
VTSNIFLNSLTGIGKTLLISVIMMVITSILLNNLGKIDYAKIALFTSVNQYVGLLLLAISGTVFKFVSIEYYKSNNLRQANNYYSSAFYSLAIISSILFLIIIALSPKIGVMLNIENYDKATETFFLLSVASLLVTSVVSIFVVAPTIKSKFYLSDFAAIASRTAHFFLILILIYLFNSLSILTYGYSLFLSSVLYLALSIYISQKLIPELSINIKSVSLNHSKKILRMGSKVVLNNLGILLYTNTDILIISVYLGSTYVADYALSLQLAIIIALLGSVVSRLFNPQIARFIGEEKFTFLRLSIVMNSKIFLVYIGIFFILVTSLSKEILILWLGDGYTQISSYVIPLAFYQLVHQSTVLFYIYFTLVNKLTIPLIVTIIAGVINMLLSIMIVSYTELGISGIVAITILTVFFKTLIFNSYYTCTLLKINFIKLFLLYLKIITFISAIAFFGYMSVDLYFNRSYFHLAFFTVGISLIYVILSYFFIFNKKDRIMFLHMTKLYSVVKRYA